MEPDMDVLCLLDTLGTVEITSERLMAGTTEPVRGLGLPRLGGKACSNLGNALCQNH